jgi:hypothetical protein
MVQMISAPIADNMVLGQILISRAKVANKKIRKESMKSPVTATKVKMRTIQGMRASVLVVSERKERENRHTPTGSAYSRH